MKKLRLLFIILLLPSWIQGQDKQEQKNPQELTLQKFNQCVSRLQSSFADYTTFAQALSLYRVAQSQWVPLYNTFRDNMGSLHKRIQATAHRMRPNPLNPFDPQKARNLLRRELYAIIKESMILSNYPTQGGFGQIAEYLISKQIPSMPLCFLEPVIIEKEPPSEKSKETHP